VSYDPENHMHMVKLRAEKINRIAQDIPEVEVYGPKEGKLLVVGWGSTYGAITTAVENMQAQGKSVSSIHLKYLNPFPKNLGDVLSRFERVIVPELNMGQLCLLLRAKFLVDAISYSKVKGKPFTISELIRQFEELV
jgi:2-oxoglutarate ferredoxin oxidoreductase subunit alpha